MTAKSLDIDVRSTLVLSSSYTCLPPPFGFVAFLATPHHPPTDYIFSRSMS